MKNQKGQMTLEAVLIVTFLVTLTVFISNQIQSRQFLQSLVERPWTFLQGMIENGVWAPTQESKQLHPNDLLGHGSPRGQG